MSSQMVDSYLDELLAPLAEEAMAGLSGTIGIGDVAANSADAVEADRTAGAVDADDTGGAVDATGAGRDAETDTRNAIDSDGDSDSARANADANATGTGTAIAAEATDTAPAASLRPSTPPPVADATIAPVPPPLAPTHAPVPAIEPPTPASTPVPAAAKPPVAPRPVMPSPRPEHAPAQRPSQGAATGNRWLRAMLGTDRYAFELLRVQEVVRTAPIIALRGASSAMLGVMNLRGRIVPVFDLARWLGTGQVIPDEHARIIVVERDDELIGVLVSAVDDVVTLAREHIEPPLLGSDPGGVVGIARVSRAPTVLLDANALFA